MKINVPLTEQTFTPLTTDLYYCKKELGEECVRDHNHLNAVLRVYVQNKCNPHDKNNFVPLYAYNSSNYDNDLFIIKLAKYMFIVIFP